MCLHGHGALLHALPLFKSKAEVMFPEIAFPADMNPLSDLPHDCLPCPVLMTSAAKMRIGYMQLSASCSVCSPLIFCTVSPVKALVHIQRGHLFLDPLYTSVCFRQTCI